MVHLFSSSVIISSLCLAPLLPQVHLGTLPELLASLGTSGCACWNMHETRP